MEICILNDHWWRKFLFSRARNHFLTQQNKKKTLKVIEKPKKKKKLGENSGHEEKKTGSKKWGEINYNEK